MRGSGATAETVAPAPAQPPRQPRRVPHLSQRQRHQPAVDFGPTEEGESLGPLRLALQLGLERAAPDRTHGVTPLLSGAKLRLQHGG
ncbi:MAG: hypothetical protein MZW92_57345 [Comamonadaceae bacterium]|nr:hypothetical protein [Comamonadaceae bacterium]